MAKPGTEPTHTDVSDRTDRPRWGLRERAAAIFSVTAVGLTLTACGPGEDDSDREPNPVPAATDTYGMTLEATPMPTAIETVDVSTDTIDGWSEMTDEEKPAAVNEYLRIEPLLVDGEQVVPHYDMDGPEVAEYLNALLERLFALRRNGGYELSQQIIEGIASRVEIHPISGRQILSAQYVLGSQTDLAGRFGPDMILPDSPDPEDLYGWAAADNSEKGARYVAAEGRSDTAAGQSGNDFSVMVSLRINPEGGYDIYLDNFAPITAGQGDGIEHLVGLWEQESSIRIVEYTF